MVSTPALSMLLVSVSWRRLVVALALALALPPREPRCLRSVFGKWRMQSALTAIVCESSKTLASDPLVR